MRCDECRWFSRANFPNANWGLCRIAPPAALMTTDGVTGYWPDVKQDDWCGHFAALASVPPATEGT